MTVSTTSGLVGRDAELGQLRTGLRDRAGTAVLAIVGVPGIGKTRLMHAVAAEARAGGARVLSARAGELERELPFGVMRQLLEPVLAAAAPGERDALLAGAAALATPALEAQPEDEASGFAVLHGLYWLVANVATLAPLVLCIDDLHWADESSLRALAYVLVRLDGIDAQVCVALRPHEPGTDHVLIDGVLAAAPSRVIHPAPFGQEAAATLVRDRLGDGADEAFCAACHTASKGNPLLLSELVHLLADDGVSPTADQASRVHAAVPGGVADSVLRRVRRIAPDAAIVAEALAILGDGAQTAHVAALAGVTDGRAAAVLGTLTRAGILERAQPPAFAHPLVRTAIEADVDPEARKRMHRDAARLLDADGVEAERLAPHVLEAPNAGDPWVVETLRAAAGATMARGAPDAAARLLRRALAEPPGAEARAAVLLAAGAAEAQAGDPRAVAHLRAVTAEAGDPCTRVRAALALAPVLGLGGQLQAGVDLLRTALEEVVDDPELRLRVEVEIVNLARLDVSMRPLALEVLARFERAELEPGPTACMVFANLATESLARGESRAEALDLSERALAGGWLLTSPIMYGLAANAIMITGGYAAAHAAWDDFIVHARPRGDLPGVAWGHAFRASAHWRAGRLAEALVDAQVALDVGPAHGFALAAGFAVAFEVEARVLRGDLAQARAAAGRMPNSGDQLQDTLLLSARGRLLLAEGRPRQALEVLRMVGRLLDRWRVPNEAMAPWRADATLALAALGAPEEARALAADATADARRWGDPWLLGQALRSAALVGPADARRAGLEAAAAVLRPSEARLELARTLVELGAAARKDGDDAAARQLQREALDHATRCGAPTVADRARTELVLAGGRPRRTASTGVGALTATEQRVARLAAHGPTNREIAQALFVTEKTVEAHLARAYRKLGIRSRGELATRLEQA
jgi:DNA-binding CsgD family transcriptional regulator